MCKKSKFDQNQPKNAIPAQRVWVVATLFFEQLQPVVVFHQEADESTGNQLLKALLNESKTCRDRSLKRHEVVLSMPNQSGKHIESDFTAKVAVREAVENEAWIGIATGVQNDIQLSSELLNSLSISAREIYRLRQAEYIDHLTGLWNRAYLELVLWKNIERMRRYSHVFSLAFMDLDNFKDINDRLGHVIGDKMLKECARFVKHEIREADILGRYGGDEFLIILPMTTRSGAEAILGRLESRFGSHMFNIFDCQSISISFSAGIVESSEFDLADSPATIIDRADQEMREVKFSRAKTKFI